MTKNRMQCNNLNEPLYSTNIIDSSACLCVFINEHAAVISSIITLILMHVVL